MDGATALFSSAITVQRLHADIINPADLRDRVVATVEFTPSVPTMNYPAAEQRGGWELTLVRRYCGGLVRLWRIKTNSEPLF